MPTSLIALGSNIGDRAATLGTALSEIDALPNVCVEQHSKFYNYPAIGGDSPQHEYLNAVAVIETSIAPHILLDQLQRIESRHGRTRTARWGARTLDLDLLTYDDEIIDTATLIVPHPRMAYRRFVLEPAAEVAPKLIHPIIGWPLDRLALHLNAGRDEVAVLSPTPALRDHVSWHLSLRFGAKPIQPPEFEAAVQLWPPEYASWLAVPASNRNAEQAASTPETSPGYAAQAFPKLTVLLDGDADVPHARRAEWSRIARLPGRGPMLRLHEATRAEIETELNAAIESVWSDLGPDRTTRIE